MAGLAVAIAVLLPAPALDAAEQQTTQVFVEDFEVRDHVAATWVTSVTAPPWQRTNERAAHGAYSLTDSPGGDYASGVDTWARTAVPIDVAGRDGCGLRYALRLAVAPPASGAAGDRLLVETSSDATQWTTRQVVATGTAGQFADQSVDLSGVGPTVYLRFRLLSDAAGADDGAHVDDVRVDCGPVQPPPPPPAPGPPPPTPTPPAHGGAPSLSARVRCGKLQRARRPRLACRAIPGRNVARIEIRLQQGERTIRRLGRPGANGRFSVVMPRRLATGRVRIALTLVLWDRTRKRQTLTRRWG